jgi:hypothetical protein
MNRERERAASCSIRPRVVAIRDGSMPSRPRRCARQPVADKHRGPQQRTSSVSFSAVHAKKKTDTCWSRQEGCLLSDSDPFWGIRSLKSWRWAAGMVAQWLRTQGAPARRGFEPPSHIKVFKIMFNEHQWRWSDRVTRAMSGVTCNIVLGT